MKAHTRAQDDKREDRKGRTERSQKLETSRAQIKPY